MLWNYIKITLRTLYKQKLYTVINVLGLAVGISCSVLIMLYVYQEFSFDSFHQNTDRLYRVNVHATVRGTESINGRTPGPIGPALIEDYPEVEQMVRLYAQGGVKFTADEKNFFDESGFAVDSSFFDIFSYNVLLGDKETMLDGPNKIVLTKSTANKYFGDADPLGKIVTYDDRVDMVVTGIIEDMPANTRFQGDYIISFPTLHGLNYGGLGLDSWGTTSSLVTYVVLHKGVDPLELEEKAYGFMESYHKATGGSYSRVVFEKLSDIHLYSTEDGIGTHNNNIQNIYIISSIALFILLLACINYVNLTTAGSVKRAREVGVRKMLGAQRKYLINQFMGESLIITVCAMLLSLGLIEIVLPYFSNLAGVEIENKFLTSGLWFLLFAAFSLFVGILAGVYPALFLSKYKPVQILKSSSAFTTGGNTVIRKSLVVIQFTVTAALLVGTTVIYQQYNFLLNKKLGFDKEYNIVFHQSDYDNVKKHKTIKTELERIPGVISITACAKPPIGNWGFGIFIYTEEGEGFGIQVIHADKDYIDHFGLELLAGRGIRETEESAVSDEMIINETLMRKLGYQNPDEIIGKQFDLTWSNWRPAVVGVLKDYHTESLHREIDPVIIMYDAQFLMRVVVKIESADMMATVAKLTDKWESFQPGYPLNYVFLDEYINKLYQSEARTLKIISTFCLLAIFIGCMGLFALAAFTAQQRTKEIGIRRVFGATVRNILVLLTKDFVKLIILSALIAMPAAYYLMNEWLSDFPYRIDIGAGVFLITFAASIVIAVLTVSFQAVKAALTNPVKSLRYE